MKRTLAMSAAATVAGGLVAFSLASYASSSAGRESSPSGDPYAAAALDLSSTSNPPASATGKRAFLHGERVVKDEYGKVVTVDSQRGTVTASSMTSLTVKSSDATTWTWTLDHDTKTRGSNLETEPGSSVKVGDTVAVAGQRAGDIRTARMVVDPPPNLKGLRGDLRKLRQDLRNLRLR
jgi:hypothetical protein